MAQMAETSVSPACLRPLPHLQDGSLCCRPPSRDDGRRGLEINVERACYRKSRCGPVTTCAVFFFFSPLWSSQGTQISHSAPWEISSNARYMSVAGDVSTGAEAQRAHGPFSMPLARDKERSSQFALTWREQKDASQKGSESEVGRLGTSPTGRG